MDKSGIQSNPITLTRQLLMDEAVGENKALAVLMASIQLACKTISQAVRKAGIAGLYGLHGSVNATGDSVKKLDMISNDVFINALTYSRELSVLVSEELEEPLIVEDALQGQYCVVTDPLDGSSNIDCNVSTGTIFGIYKRNPSAEAGGNASSSSGDTSSSSSSSSSAASAALKSVLRPGRELVAAGYCMYGSSTQMVLTTGHGVNGFTLDPSIGEFILTHPNIRIPDKPKTVYSVNEGNARYWDAPTTAFVSAMKNQEGKPYSLRYVGSMVSDVHRTLLYLGPSNGCHHFRRDLIYRANKSIKAAVCFRHGAKLCPFFFRHGTISQNPYFPLFKVNLAIFVLIQRFHYQSDIVLRRYVVWIHEKSNGQVNHHGFELTLIDASARVRVELVEQQFQSRTQRLFGELGHVPVVRG